MLRKQFLKTIQKFKMIEKGETVLVAVSGGADSVVLLNLLVEIKDSWKLKLGVLHVNHQLRGKASDRDEAFVKKLSRHFEIPCHTIRIDVKKKARAERLSLEEAAREARLNFFEQTAKKKRAPKIALAHNLDDQAETVLMRVITGTGLQGLQAIRPKRRLNGIDLVRPLIEIQRQDIRKFAKEHSIQFREDSSNQSRTFLRNRIRLELIPLIEKQFNPRVKRTLARLPHLLDADLAFLDGSAGISYQRLAREKANEVLFSKKSFLKLSPAIQFRLINRALRVFDGIELDFSHWNDFSELLSHQPRFQLQLPKGFFAVVSREEIRIKRAKKHSASFSYPLALNQPLHIPEIGATLSGKPLRKRPRLLRKQDPSFDVFDAAKLSFPLAVRSRKPGDRFQPLGQSKFLKLKKFLINRHIPQEERDRLPLVFSNGAIAWVGGVGMAEPFKVTPQTKKFLRVSIVRGNSA